MTCNCSLFVEIGGEKFAIDKSDEWVEVIHVPSRDNVEVETVVEMAEFMREHSRYQLPVDNDLYMQVMHEVIQNVLSPTVGVSKREIETLIGSFVESLPDECDSLLKYVKRL